MPSIRKRIGYLPSVNIHEIITSIAKKENLSQSKVVGILVEEALTARGLFTLKNKNDIASESFYTEGKSIHYKSLKYCDLDELISDKGITYDSKKYKHKSNNFSSDPREPFNEELFEQFKKFILFQKMIEEKNKFH